MGRLEACPTLAKGHSPPLLKSAFLAVALCLNSFAADQAPPVGLRLGTGYASARPAEGSGGSFTAVNLVSFYQAMPPGLYSNIWGIFVGITNYQSAGYNGLVNAARDARDLSRAFEEVCGLRQPILLLDNRATHRGLEEAFTEIGRRDGPADLFVFHFSGHGFGIESKETGAKAGYMLLHDAPPPENFALGRGLLNMSLLQRMAETAGIEAKHQLYLLDCCYSGMGARARNVLTRDTGIDAAQANLKDMLAQRGNYIMTAGGAGQPVLDGPSGPDGGYGLLSGFLVRTLRDPDLRGLKLETFGGVSLLPARRLFEAANQEIRTQARGIWDAQYRRWQETKRGSLADRLPRRDGGSTVFDQLSGPDEFFKLIQNPQDGTHDAEGWIYLPIRSVAASKPTPPPSTLPPPEPPATSAPPGPSAPQGLEWFDRVGAQYGAADYATKLQKLFRLLNSGLPPKAEQPGAIELEAELARRPRIDSGVLEQLIPAARLAEQYPQAKGDDQKLHDLQLVELERWRRRNPGTHWESLRHRGDVASVHYELRVHLSSRGSQPLHYYVLQLDEAGVLQWIAPRNNSWRDDEFGEKLGYLTHGVSPLAGANTSLFLPADHSVAGQAVTLGWPVEDDDLDLQFYIVASRTRWPELEAALNEASSAAWEIFERQKAPKKKVGGQMPEVVPGVRALGRVNQTLLPTKPHQTDPSAPPPLLNRTDENLLVLSWLVDVKRGEEFRPELRVASGR
jgi:hypothetical protein